MSRADGRRDDGKAHDHCDHGQRGDWHGPEPGPAAAARAGPAQPAAAAAARQEGGKPAGPGMRPAAAASLIAEIAGLVAEIKVRAQRAPCGRRVAPWLAIPARSVIPAWAGVSASGAILTSLVVILAITTLIAVAVSRAVAVVLAVADEAAVAASLDTVPAVAPARAVLTTARTYTHESRSPSHGIRAGRDAPKTGTLAFRNHCHRRFGRNSSYEFGASMTRVTRWTTRNSPGTSRNGSAASPA